MNLKTIYYKVDHGNYGLNILLDLQDRLLLFDSVKFSYIDSYAIINFQDWDIFPYDQLNKGVQIDEIKEDELVSYFIKFNNNDILFISQNFYTDGEWGLNFKIVSPNSSDYNYTLNYMYEDWVEKIKI